MAANASETPSRCSQRGRSSPVSACWCRGVRERSSSLGAAATISSGSRTGIASFDRSSSRAAVTREPATHSGRALKGRYRSEARWAAPRWMVGGHRETHRWSRPFARGRHLRPAERRLLGRLGMPLRGVLQQAGFRRPAPLSPKPGLVHVRSTGWSGGRDGRRAQRPRARLAGRRSGRQPRPPADRGGLRPRAELGACTHRPRRKRVDVRRPGRSCRPLRGGRVVPALHRVPPSGELFPAGSILVTEKPKTSAGIRIVSYALTGALVVAAVIAFRFWRRRRRLAPGSSSPGSEGS